MPNVYELTGAFNNIVRGSPLIFPNVLTCMAFVAYDGANLIGVHFTQLDQTTARVSGAWMRVQLLSAGGHHVYIAGPKWNANLLANLVPAPASFHNAVSQAGIDIQETLAAGAVTFYVSGPWRRWSVARAATGLSSFSASATTSIPSHGAPREKNVLA